MIPFAGAIRVAPGNAIVFAPHPDDEVFGCAGAICAHLAHSETVRVVLVTDGAFVAESGSVARTEIARIRLDESTSAGSVLGYGKPENWGFPDRGLAFDEDLIVRVMSAIGESRAQVVYATSIWELHPDHRALAHSVLEAARRLGGDLRIAMYEVSVPMQPNLLLDITPYLEKKRRAAACFASQQQRQDYVSQVLALNRFRTYTLGPDVVAAEAYFVIDAGSLDADCLSTLRGAPAHLRDRLPNAASESEQVVRAQRNAATFRAMELQRELDAVTRSRSWRLTAPLRWIARYLLP